MLPHWPRQVGLGDPYADAQAVLSGRGTVDLSTLQAAAGLSPDKVIAQGQQVASQVSGDVAAQWNSATSAGANQARVGAGVSAASDLLSSGYDPNNSDDNQKLIVAVAGAVSLIPGVGPILGGAVMVLDAIAQGIAHVLEDVGLIWFGCRTSGNWTIANALDTMRLSYQGQQFDLPPIRGRDFASLVIPMLAANLARVDNCKGALQNLQIVTAAAAMWNAGASGPPIKVYVPAMSISNNTVFTVAYQVPYAFRPADDVTAMGDFGSWTSSPNGQILQSSFNQNPAASPPFILELAGSAYTPPSGQSAQSQSYQGPLVTTSSTASTSLSAPAKVAVGAAIVGGTALAGSAVYAAATKQSFTGLWAQLLRRAKFW